MERNSVILCLLCWLSLAAVPAQADVQYLSQARSVSAQNSEGASASAAAPDFAPFAASARVSWEYTGPRLPPGTGTQRYSATALQDSVLSLQEITAQGYADDVEPFYHYVDFGQESLSDFHVVFATDASYEFLLTGRIEAWGDYGGTDYGTYLAKVEWSDDMGPLVSASVDPATPLHPGSQVLDLYETFIVDPGVYTLDVRASAQGWGGPGPEGPGRGGSGGAEYDLRLTVIPAPAVLPLALCGLGAVAFLKRRKILP
jgi:hypothetical protein